MAKFLFLSEKKNDKMISFLKERGQVTWMDRKINLEDVKDFDWIISFGYRNIISKNIIDKTKNKIINLHISYLPYNRGANPNYWSFKENTPKGVSIHFIDEGIDTGPILLQSLCEFDESQTLKSSYNILIQTIENLFFDNFDKIMNGKVKSKPQVGNGTYHKKNDLLNNINYNTKIKEI